MSMGRHLKFTHWEMSMYFKQRNSQMLAGSVCSAGHAYSLRICRDCSFPKSAGSWYRLWQLVTLKFLSEGIAQMHEGSWNKASQ
ncbi:hypothetical protein ACFX13_043428 [Malus domestica]